MTIVSMRDGHSRLSLWLQSNISINFIMQSHWRMISAACFIITDRAKALNYKKLSYSEDNKSNTFLCYTPFVACNSSRLQSKLNTRSINFKSCNSIHSPFDMNIWYDGHHLLWMGEWRQGLLGLALSQKPLVAPITWKLRRRRQQGRWRQK